MSKETQSDRSTPLHKNFQTELEIKSLTVSLSTTRLADSIIVPNSGGSDFWGGILQCSILYL